MANNEDRLDALEEKARQQEAASFTLLGVVQGIDTKLTEALGTVRSTQAHEAIVDARLSAIDARAQAAAAEMKLFKSDMERSFRQVADAMVPKEDIADIQRHMDALGAKMDQVIALLTKQGE